MPETRTQSGTNGPISAIWAHIFSITPCKSLILLLVTRADRRFDWQILAYKEVTRKIFRNKELAEYLWKDAGLKMVAEFGRMKQVCAFGFREVKVVRHNDSDRSCGKADKASGGGREFAGQCIMRARPCLVEYSAGT